MARAPDPEVPADLIDPQDAPERQRDKLLVIAGALMKRVEQATDDGGAAYAQFQRAVLLEDEVRERTRDLERALDLLNLSNARLAEANRATEAARRNLASALEQLQEGFALFDPSDRLILFNSRFCLALRDIHARLAPGLAFADYVGMVSRSSDLALPAGQGPDDWRAGRMRAHREPHANVSVSLTGDRWLQVSEHRTLDGGTVILQTDVTDIIRLERETRGRLLDDQARGVRATLDHLAQGVAIFDAQARLIGWNRRFGELLALPMSALRMGAEFGLLMDRLPRDFRLAGLDAAALLAWAAAQAGGAARPHLRFGAERGDAALVLDIFAQEMPDRGFVISLSDVTAERAAIAALSQANETLEARVRDRTLELEDALADAERANASRARFVAAASHDLLQPLSAARLFLSAAEDGPMPPPLRETLGKAQNALDSVEAILGALLDISKLDSGKAAVTPGPVDLAGLLAQLAEEFGPVAAARGLALRVWPARHVVRSDPAYLRRILQNLIGNAIRYTERGRVVVGARRRGQMLQLEVWDTGPGIPEAEQDNIFREFHRLNARASASEGMGLGLAIVERAAALLGHPLGLRSVTGRGTVFLLQVPVERAGAAAPAAIPPGSDAAGRLQARAVTRDRIALLVEPDADLRRAIGLLLEKWGMNVLDAADGPAALALITEIGILPDVLLVDTGAAGAGAASRFVQQFCDLHGDLPCCLFLSGAEAADLPDGMTCLKKPLDPAALQAFLTGVLAS
ncbi:PAS-domain containing protein [Szabonella alba]|uniref:histidine kinase n=1 Tax=Szabonella alba TaxID=2804194 RepID=A0A8K0VB76_9RHOB|nr:PAS-domain containing protein [Szabonella alba]MBL4917781.1 PAS-domain containing protein [Szabonella alba]